MEIPSFQALSFDDYVSLLLGWIENLKRNGASRGVHAALAKAAGVHNSYFSRVLRREVHLLPDQAVDLAESQAWSARNTEYFLQLVSLARAGSPRLKKIILTRIEQIKKEAQDLGQNLSAKKIDLEQANPYYSEWYYPVVHLALGFPGKHNARSLAAKLNLPLALIDTSLQLLESLGLAAKDQGYWRTIEKNIHLPNQSWLAPLHHKSWRLKTCQELSFRKSDSIHYSGLHSLSAKDFQRVRSTVQELLLQVDKIVRPSPEEEICHLGIDWFRI